MLLLQAKLDAIDSVENLHKPMALNSGFRFLKTLFDFLKTLFGSLKTLPKPQNPLNLHHQKGGKEGVKISVNLFVSFLYLFIIRIRLNDMRLLVARA